MGLFYNESKPGKGKEKEESNEKLDIRFLKILYAKIWDLTKLNLLYLLFLLPTYLIVFLWAGIITSGTFAENTSIYAPFYEIFVRIVITSFFTVLWGMGPATAGITNVLIKFAKREPSFLWSDFAEGIKVNFRQSLIVFAVDIVAFLVLYSGVIFYGTVPGFFGIITSILIISVIFVYTMMHFYIYPILATYDMRLLHIYYNALIYTLGKLPRTFLTLLIILAIHLGIVYTISNFSVGILVLFLGVAIIYALSAFIVTFNSYENMREYVNADKNK